MTRVVNAHVHTSDGPPIEIGLSVTRRSIRRRCVGKVTPGATKPTRFCADDIAEISSNIKPWYQCTADRGWRLLAFQANMQIGAKPRKKPRQERSLATYDAILEAATRIFGERGYAGTTTNEIAELAGVSIGSLYQYFPNKDALIGALQWHHKKEIAAAVKTVLTAAPDRTIRESVTALVVAWFAVHLRDMRFHQRLETEFSPFDRSDEEDIQLEQAIVSDLAELLAHYKRDIVPANWTLASHIIMRTLVGHAHAALETPIPGVSNDMLEDGVVKSILGYLTNR